MKPGYTLLVESVAGSRLYGTHRADSDTDLRGVCLAPAASLIGLDPAFEQVEEKEPADRVIWELRKFVRLALDNNPNILDTLFAPQRFWTVAHPDWAMLYRMRHDVLSTRVRKTYAGYATSQLHRIQLHKRWLDNPPTEPVPGDYGAVDKAGGGKTFPDGSRRSAYEATRSDWEKYQMWLKGRNPARAQLERSFGYDTKHAAHLTRLLLQGKTILETGTFCPVLDGEDKEHVLSVLAGQWHYNELIEWSGHMFDRIATIETDLPDRPRSGDLQDFIIDRYTDHILEARELRKVARSLIGKIVSQMPG